MVQQTDGESLLTVEPLACRTHVSGAAVWTPTRSAPERCAWGARKRCCSGSEFYRSQAAGQDAFTASPSTVPSADSRFLLRIPTRSAP
jgi:hypothetical protein